ncbi:phosphate ABC transporter substrate-binding protein [Agaribacterium haliotis]|uniref:phosphate ABC transporter substrate-binding protein n=1 Tax=Agaribacterium haliotis TaxID=2013869 RepID=UPI000BB55D12|nr:phosphate ABC transporter substrate-binding protein [Agaribacterium haliotis]
MKLDKVIKSATRSLLILATLVAFSAHAGIAVIVHPSNTDTLDRNDVAHIFLGKTKAFPSGRKAVPLDQGEDSLLRAAFNQTVLKKSPQKLRSYWAKQMFTGQGEPPKVVDGDAAMLKAVAENPSAIGYIEDVNVDDSVHVVYLF